MWAAEWRSWVSNKPLISVVLPVYNGEQYLPAALDSILAQTLRDFEIIAIDDGSTDGTLAILRDYERKDSRIRVVTRGNMNLPNTLNEGVDLARGTWIARMDHDDVALPHRFECQIAWLIHTGADIAGSWIRPFGSGDRRIVKHATTDGAIKVEMLFGSPFAHPTVMMRTELVKQLRYDPAWHGAEDYDLWERAVAAGWSMTNVPEVLLSYRQHASQISMAKRSHQIELTQQIQKRYCAQKRDEFSISEKACVEMLKIRQLGEVEVQMDAVDEAMKGMLAPLHGEALQIGLFYSYRLYLLAAHRRVGVTDRWRELCRSVGVPVRAKELFKLRLIQALGARPDGRLFASLKRLYLSVKH